MKEKRVLSVIHAPRWGGIHTLAERIGTACAAKGYRWITVLPKVPGDNGRERLERAGLDVECIPLRRVRKSLNPITQLVFLATIPIDVWRLWRMIRRLDIDVVQANGLIHFHSAIAAKLAGVPLVWILHSDQPPRPLKRFFTPWVRVLADAVMTSGQALVASHRGLETISSRIVAFAAPVDTTVFRPDLALRSEVREEFGAAPDDVVVGAVGGRGPNKNHGLLVDAMKIVRAGNPKVKLRICGAQNPTHAEWFALNVVKPAETAGMLEDGTVGFADPGTAVARYMAGFDVFCLSSRGEGASIVVSEAMSCALPVVANAVGGVPESVFEGETGFLNHSLSAEEMARHILHLAGDPDLRVRMGQAGRAFAQASRSIEACAAAHVRAYDLAARGAGHDRASDAERSEAA